MNPEVLEKLDIVTITLPTPFPVGPVNAFLVKGDPLVLIDTGLKSEETYQAVVGQLKEHGYSIRDLDAIVATHGHRDHMGLLGRLQQETDAKIYAHPDVARMGAPGEDRSAARKAFYQGILAEFGVAPDIIEMANSLYERFRSFSEPFSVDHVVKDEERFLFYTAYYVPGHSSSDTLFIDADRKITFSGDHILVGTSPNPIIRQTDPGQERAKALLEYQQSLRRSRELDLGLCFPGHGEPFDNHVEVVDRILSRHEQRALRIKGMVKEGASTPYQVSKGLFPRLPDPNLHLGLSIAVGHLEVLEDRGVLTVEKIDGVLHYSPAA